MLKYLVASHNASLPSKPPDNNVPFSSRRTQKMLFCLWKKTKLENVLQLHLYPGLLCIKISQKYIAKWPQHSLIVWLEWKSLIQTPKEQKQPSTNYVAEVSTPWRCKFSEVGIKVFTKKMLLKKGYLLSKRFL